MMEIQPAALTIQGAVAYSGLPRSRLYQFAAEGRLTFRRAGRRTLVMADELRALLASLPRARASPQRRSSCAGININNQTP